MFVTNFNAIYRYKPENFGLQEMMKSPNIYGLDNEFLEVHNVK